jgi:hypothetical protein
MGSLGHHKHIEGEWLRVQQGNGPLEGPLAPRYIQCHAEQALWVRGHYLRCSNIKRRDRIGVMSPEYWMCHHHQGHLRKFTDQLPFEPCEPKLTGIALLEAVNNEREADMHEGTISPFEREIIAAQKRLDTLRDQEAAFLAKEAERLERQRIREEKFGRDEDYENGTVIMFDHVFDRGQPKRYTYTAMKCAPVGQWYTSGPMSPGPYTWDELCRFIGDEEVWIVKEWDLLA